ncbi:sugar transferase [Planococcus faecalis]|uniref:Sugar transferase n=1 Tax=Planococcus faecalis TaxID=1598147 RepID=A0ABM6IXB6_9BACL|nr:sugar transferase [Planococcus faecalis]AQU81092.1 sugar transferase [Planococcus faecalis]OHX52005.1 sugar transferase [Planococcus faecalis]
MEDSKRGLYRQFLKRPIDLLLSLIAIIALSPVFLVVGILVRTKLGSPILFKQARPGLNEKLFLMYKFRTMTDRKDEKGELLSDSERITGFGKFLRSTSLDELPSLFNILKGDMSIVGPRPLLVRYLPYYRIEERKRSHVRPGITGLAQINGRNALTWDERFKVDVSYAKKMSFLLDFKIIIGTILVVFQRKDILVGTEHILKDLDIERKEEFSNEIIK